MKKFITIAGKALVIAIVGVLVIDYLSHFFFSDPMETWAYFMTKMSLYFVFSIIFLSVMNLERRRFMKVAVGGIIVASLWGIYYNILPYLFDFYPFGIPLQGLTFLGMGLLGTGLAFGIVHTLAFVGGYYSTRFLSKRNVILGAIAVIAILALTDYYAAPAPKPPADYKDATYSIDGTSISLGSGSTARYFGDEAKGDLNGDGTDDVAFIITDQPGGSGTFYYAVAALGENGGYVGTNGILLGDRIAPQTVEIRNGQIIVNYADRAPGQAMVTRPSVGVSKYLKISGDDLVVVK